MTKTMKSLGYTISALIGLGWLGLKINPKPFPAASQPSPTLDSVPLPADLPAPVVRFYRRLYGERVPLIETAVITGQATMRISAIPFPARFRITHLAGQAYHHRFELCFFGQPLLTVNETYLHGKCRLELPFGVAEGPKVDQAANLALWAETLVWLPALLVTDSRVRWAAIDEETARLKVPFGAGEQSLVVRFDPASGNPRLVESMRYKGQDSPAKTLWLNEILAWQSRQGHPICTAAALTWLDEGQPWANFNADAVSYNVAVSAYLGMEA